MKKERTVKEFVSSFLRPATQSFKESAKNTSPNDIVYQIFTREEFENEIIKQAKEQK